MEAKVNSTKSQVDTYILRWEGQYWWAIFYVDDAHGALSIQSDFGDYSHRWGAPSKPFKKFLAEIGTDYLMDKLTYGNGHGKYFYDIESIKRLEKAVGERCDEEQFCPDERAKYFDAIEEIDGYDCKDSNMFFHLAYTNEDLAELFNHDPHAIADCIVTGYSPALRQFVENIWPSFVSALTAELALQQSEDK